MTLFATERLIVRRLETGDADAMFAVYGDADAMRWVEDGEPLERADCDRWVVVTHRNYEIRGYGMSVLTLKTSGDIIGFCGLVHPENQPEAEIKYALKRDYWGQGLATEAIRGMLAYGAGAHGLQRIIATVAPEHLASQRVLRKAGMWEQPLRQNDDGSVTKVFAWNPDTEPTP